MSGDVPAATTAVFVDVKHVASRAIVQLIFEVPIEKTDSSLAALGGMPRAENLQEVAVVRMSPAEAVAGAAEVPDDAIGATFAAFRTVQTRAVAQFVLELPDSRGDAALAALGGTPRPNVQFHVAIARMQPPGINPVAQAGIACKDPRFQQFLLGEAYVEGNQLVNEAAATAYVRRRLGIRSRAELKTSEDAQRAWAVLFAQSRAAP